MGRGGEASGWSQPGRVYQHQVLVYGIWGVESQCTRSRILVKAAWEGDTTYLRGINHSKGKGGPNRSACRADLTLRHIHARVARLTFVWPG